MKLGRLVACVVVLLCVKAWGETPSSGTHLTKMREDTLGMFIHWGLYAIPAVGEWHLWRDNVPLAEYNALTNRFAPPASFSPRQWVKLAKRMGARYAVLTTRHHDGFCLFDTKTTDYNSFKTAARRDFVREFAEACRAEGVRVGFYYSIMNWQYYPRQSKDFDQTVWNEQVRTTHEALRELMTNYGQVDYLWYDGCRAPGGNDAEYMERMWRIRDLNAMVRSLQPGILINDRSMVPEDYSTPEQSLAAPPPGRAWESCITVNGWWGYRADDDTWKTSETLFRSLLHCVRHGGNLLINIGPRADGSVPEGCVKALEGLGDRIRECPESIYGSVRDEQTETTREGGVVTCAGGSYWFWALETNRLDGVETMERRGPRAWKVSFKKGARPCACLGKRHDLDLASGATPVLGDTAELEAPPNGAVELIDEPTATSTVFTLPAGGEWRLEVGYVNSDGFRDTCRRLVAGSAAGEKVTVAVPNGGKGVYARRMTPVWRKLAPKGWQIAGVFTTPAVAANFTDKSVRAVFAKDLVAEAKAAAFAPVPDANDRADKGDVRLSYVYSAKTKTQGLAFARRTVKSATARSVHAALGCDWWGQVYVNGKEALGYGMGWKPRAFRLDLQPGDNEILVACHSGSGQHWFTFFVNDGFASAPAKPILVYNEDNSAFFFQAKYGNDLSEAALRAHVARLAAGGKVTHYFMCPNAMCASFDAKTRDPIWKYLDDPTQVSYGWMRGIKRVHDLGIDPYAVWTDECRQKGISPWLTMRMNDIHNAEDPNNAQHSTFWRRHPEFRRGYPDGLADCGGNALDYAHKAVRDYNLAFVAELLERYDVDGIELDWLRFPLLLREGREQADAHFLTDFVREAKALVVAAAKRRGHAVRLGVRVPTRPERAKAVGLDVAAWTKDGLVDWIVPCNQWASPDYALPYADWQALAGDRVTIVPGLDFNITFDGQRRPLAYDEYAAYAARLYRSGAEGVYLFNLFDHPKTDGVWNDLVDRGLLPQNVEKMSVGLLLPADFN